VLNNPLSFTDPTGFVASKEDPQLPKESDDGGKGGGGEEPIEEVVVTGSPPISFGGGRIILLRPSIIWGGKTANGERIIDEVVVTAPRLDAQKNSAQKGRLNPFKIIQKEFPQWWSSEETQDLRQGINLSLDGLSIPYKMLRAPLDYKDYGQLIYQSINGDFGEAGITLTGILAGKTTVRFMEESFKMQDSVINAAGVVTSNSSKYVVEQDCFSCK
uniref:hypothetical protein n=1 Tax=uncultured Microbulbifer sp. TaxID=348147 RepID=UPI00260DC97C